MTDSQSNEPSIVPVSEGEAWAAVGKITSSNELAIAIALIHALWHGAVDDLNDLVTPESLPRWRDGFEAIRQMVAGCTLTTGVEYAAPHVAYVKAVHGLDSSKPGLVLQDMTVRADIITLVYREDLGGWRAHGIGAPVAPAQIKPPEADTL